MEIKVRSAKAEDINFIYATLLRALFYGNTWYSLIDKDAFFEHYPKVLTALINKPGVSIKIACLADDADVILGYAIVEGTTLHWCSVKEAWRMQGIAKRLIEDRTITTVTHITKVGDVIRKKKNWGFNPFKI